jgi:RNA recognition motif-containing protein
MFTESSLRALFSKFGTIDGIIIDKHKSNKAYVMFRYRDSAKKAFHSEDEDEILK